VSLSDISYGSLLVSVKLDVCYYTYAVTCNYYKLILTSLPTSDGVNFTE